MSTATTLKVFYAASLLSAIAAMANSEEPKRFEPKSAAIDLCAALRAIQPGDRLRVVVEGVYQSGHLSDLFDPYCGGSVQPVALVELAPGVTEPSEFVELLRKDHRVYAQFSGVLEGRSKPSPDDLTLPSGLAYVPRVHGQNSKFRTRLLVSEITNIWPADYAEKGTPRWHISARSPLPEVQLAQLPTSYPKLAYNTGVYGDVVVEIDLKVGNTISTKVISVADRLLVQDTLENIRTWRFDPAAEGTFTTTFSYRLENDLPSTTASVRVSTELPVRVEVIAPRSNW
jgi:hypothetical protein